MCAIFYTHQTCGAYAGLCVCDRTRHMEKTGDSTAKKKHWTNYGTPSKAGLWPLALLIVRKYSG